MAKKFAVFDIDGTLIRWQLFHVIFKKLGKAGHYQPGDYERLQTAHKAWKTRATDESFKEYEAVLIDIVARNLSHVPVAAYHTIIDQALDEYKDQVYRYTRDLIKELKLQGYTILAISGSPSEAIKQLAEYYGFDDFVGTVHYRKNGLLTGKIEETFNRKPQLLKQLVARHGLSFAGSIGVGDSEGDLSMLELVEQPIAFNPSKKLFTHAQAKGWKIVIERKNMIYELEPAGGKYVLTHTNA